MRIFFFSLQNLTQTKTHQFVLIMAISSKVFQNMKKSQGRHLSSNIGRAQYISQEKGKRIKRERRKREKGKRSKEEK